MLAMLLLNKTGEKCATQMPSNACALIMSVEGALSQMVAYSEE